MTKKRVVVVVNLLVSILFLWSSNAYGEPASAYDLSTVSKRVDENTATEADLKYLIAIVEKQPGNVEANIVLSQLLDAQGFEQLAIDALDRAIKSNPSSALAHYRRCLILFRQNDADGAMKELAVTEPLLANDGDKLFQLGLALDRVGKREDGKRLFKKSAQAGHKGAGYGVNLAQIRMSQGKLNEALEAVEWDLRSNAQDVRANLVKASILSRLGDVDGASKCYVAAARFNPCDQGAAAEATRHLTEVNRYEDALGTALLDLLCFKRDAKAMERSKLVVIELLHRVPNRRRQSEIVMGTASSVEQSRRCRYFRLALGDIFDRMHRPQKAMEQYQLALHTCPVAISDDTTLARGMFRLGRDYEIAMRNPKEALDYYQRALQFAPDDAEIKANYKRLSRRLTSRDNDFASKIKETWYSFWQALSPVPPN